LVEQAVISAFLKDFRGVLYSKFAVFANLAKIRIHYYGEKLKMYKSYLDDMPKRNIGCVYHIDANRINAKQKDANVNQLEKWHKNRVIFLEMSRTAYEEAGYGDLCRSEKTDDYTWMSSNAKWDGIDEFRVLIEDIVFPKGAKNQNEINDISILLDAKMSNATLVTNDGGSNRQKGGLLGNANRLLSEVGIKVLNAEQAVKEVRDYILARDNIARNVAKACGCGLPRWVGKD